jgi:hypothetical protein
VVVAAYLVTGNPGSGKSTIAAELTRRGLVAIDPDYDRKLSYWENAAGTAVDGPDRPDEAWLRSHRWVWSRSRLTELVGAKSAVVFVCGIARNQDQLLDLFDAVFLLRMDAVTQEERLAAHDVAHPPGRSDAGRQEIRAGRAVFETQMRKLGAISVDCSAPPAAVVDALQLLIASPTLSPHVKDTAG